MESLYTKYRPQTFADVVGQEHVVQTLERAVLSGKISHAYLFCGPRGNGKTTMARILAKALLCDEGPNALPDGTCEQCQLIARSEHPDVHEMDAASRTGVDDVRQSIIGRVDYAPVMGRYQVFIIDEVHMLSTAAFNALLKTLEEPPSHVVFILCTTDPQKVPATILSRVQRFDFHASTEENIAARLAYICQAEGFEAEPEALTLVARHARGGMRDALSMLEQLSTAPITVAAVRAQLGEVASSTLEQVATALAQRDVAALFGTVAQLSAEGSDMLQFVRDLSAHVRDLYVVSIAGARDGLVAASGDDVISLAREAALFGGPDRLAHVLTVLGDTADRMRFATNQRLEAEIAFTKLAHPGSDLTLESLAERIEALEQGRGAQPAAVAPAPIAAPATPVAATQPPAPPQPAVSLVPESPVGASFARPRAEGAQPTPQVLAAGQPQMPPQPAIPTATPQPAPTPEPATAAPVPPAPAPAPADANVMTSFGSEGTVQGTAQPTASVPNDVIPVASGTGQQPTAPAVTQRPAPAPTVPPQPAPAAPPAPLSPTPPSSALPDPSELLRTWRRMIAILAGKNPMYQALLLSANPVSDDGTTLTAELPPKSTFATKMLKRKDVFTALQESITEAFGAPREFEVVEAATTATTPAAPTRPPIPQPVGTQIPTPAPTPQPAPEPADANAMTSFGSEGMGQGMVQPPASVPNDVIPVASGMEQQPAPNYDGPSYDDYVPAESYDTPEPATTQPPAAAQPQAPQQPAPVPTSAPWSSLEPDAVSESVTPPTPMRPVEEEPPTDANAMTSFGSEGSSNGTAQPPASAPNDVIPVASETSQQPATFGTPTQPAPPVDIADPNTATDEEIKALLTDVFGEGVSFTRK